MNPFIRDSLGGIIRTLIAGLIPMLVSLGITEADAQTFAASLTAIVVAGGWSIWQKFKSRQKIETAKATSGPTSEAAVIQKVADGQAPSVMTAASVTPVLSPKA